MCIENVLGMIICGIIIAGVIGEYYQNQAKEYYKKYNKELEKNSILSEKYQNLKRNIIQANREYRE